MATDQVELFFGLCSVVRLLLAEFFSTARDTFWKLLFQATLYQRSQFTVPRAVEECRCDWSIGRLVLGCCSFLCSLRLL